MGCGTNQDYLENIYLVYGNNHDYKRRNTNSASTEQIKEGTSNLGRGTNQDCRTNANQKEGTKKITSMEQATTKEETQIWDAEQIKTTWRNIFSLWNKITTIKEGTQI
jgi:hypothetical protein